MLVLSRKSQEKIQIGDQITISVLAVKGNVVRIGIEAPTNIHIVRSELPPLEKGAKAAAGPTAKTEGPTPDSDSKSEPEVSRVSAERVRVSMTRYPALQSRMNQRIDILKTVLAETK
jgi:carbon storage regulator CsrA